MLIWYEICAFICQLLSYIPYCHMDRYNNYYQAKIVECLQERMAEYKKTTDSPSYWENLEAELKKHFHSSTYTGGYFAAASMDSTVGKYCSIADNVSLGTTSHPTNWLSTHPFQYIDSWKFCNTHSQLFYQYARSVHIGNDVWIGKGSVIMDGVTVGDGAVIGTYAVVTHDVPPYAIVAGVPARILRYRFDKSTRQKLLELKWWDMPREKLIDLPYNDVQKCIEILQERKKSSSTVHCK